MNLLSKIKNKLVYLYRFYILRDHFLHEAIRWFKDKGDETLRLEYPLTPESLVFDLGGYRGDFAAAINERYGCKVYIFEPVLEFYKLCVTRFKGNHQVVCFNYGLSSSDGFLDIGLAENASSFSSHLDQVAVERVQIRSVVECIRELKVNQIDLMKINIEGGEYDVIPAMIESSDIEKVRNLQVQFHNFINNSASQRIAIRKRLVNTHAEMWNYEFIWESWTRK
jgi:FkbM family methyltransferase